MKLLRVFISAVLAGACIGLGGVVFLSVDERVVGAALRVLVISLGNAAGGLAFRQLHRIVLGKGAEG